MLSTILSGGSVQDMLVSLLLSLPMIMLAISAHEAAHGYVAYKCGDPTAHNLGRITLNPTKHLDLLGFLSMMIFGYGWAKPVPVHARNFKNPRRGMALTGAAGPCANLLLGLLLSVFYGFFMALTIYLSVSGKNEFLVQCLTWLSIMFYHGALINLVFMVFNLIPVPPFDGSRIAFVFLPERVYFGIMRYERQILMGTLIALLLLSRLAFSPFEWVAGNLTALVANPVYTFFLQLFFGAL